MQNPYASIDVQTASPVLLVSKLYEAAIRHARTARDAADGEVGVRVRAADRVLAIVGELRQSLAMDEGGEIAERLDSLYEYVIARVMAGNGGDANGFGDALVVLERVGEAWAELARGPAGAAHAVESAVEAR